MTKLQRGKMANKRTSMMRLIINSDSDNLSGYHRLSSGVPEEENDNKTLDNPENYHLRRNKGKSLFAKMLNPWSSSLLSLSISLLLLIIPVMGDAGGLNNWERPLNMPKIKGLEVMCGAQHMEVHLSFDLPFHGLVASKGMYGQPECLYVQPRTGQTKYVFNINYEKCGTKPDNAGKFYENTVVVQYDEELIEAWDEAKRLRCEWFNDYEKTATKTNPVVISDLEIVELNFHGDNVDCWMEIQEGKGPWAPPLNGIVPLGSPLTMVIAVKDPQGEFDMRVKACEASDGQNGHVLPLSDSEGCILRPKLIGKFSKVKLDDGRATVLTYAFLSAFKFPDMLNVHMRCTVEICRHGCPDHCTRQQQHIPAGSSNHPQIPTQTQAKRPIDSQGQHSLQEPVAYESQQQNVVVKANEIPRATPKSLPLHEESASPSPPIQQENTNNEDKTTGSENSIQKQQQGENSAPSDILDNIRDHIKQQQEEIQQHQLQQQQQQQQLQQQQQQQQQQQHHQQQPQFNQPQPQQPQQQLPQVPQQGFPNNNNNNNNIPLMAPPPPPHIHHVPLRNGPPARPGFFGGPPQGQRFPANRYPPPGKFRQPPPPPHMVRHGPPPHPQRQNGIPIMHFQQPPQQPHPVHNGGNNDGRLHHRIDTIPENIAMPRMGEADVDNSEEVARLLNTERQQQQQQPQQSQAEDAGQKQTQQEQQPLAEALKGDPLSTINSEPVEITSSAFPKGPRKLRFTRSVLSSLAGNGIIGIEGTFKVVSEADLNFALNTNTTGSPPTSQVLKGSRMLRSDDPIYGICLPRFGFGIVFFGLGLATLVAILIAVFLAYAHHVVKSSNRKNLEGHAPPNGMGMSHPPPASFHPTTTRYENVLPMIILRKMW